MTPPIAGVTGIGTYLPTGRMTVAQIAEASGLPDWVVTDKLGITEQVVPGAHDHTLAMGVRAAREALRAAGVQPDTIDLVISINEEHKEYPVWTSGIQLAHEIGASKAWAFDLGQKCGSAVLGLRLARDMLNSDPAIDTILVAGGYRNVDLVDYSDPNVRFLFNLGAGGAAYVVQRGHGHAVLGSAVRTDGSFSHDVIVPVGGTMHPATPENLQDYRLTVPDPRGMKERLEQKSLDNFVGVVEDALRASGATAADVAYVAMLHMKRSAHDTVLHRLGLDASQAIYLSDYGHLGQADQALSLQLAAQRGQLRDGDLVVLVAAGIGYVWNAICLRWSTAHDA